VLFTSLLAGLVLMALGQWLGRQLDRQSIS